MALPILDFLVQRMTEYDPSYEHRVGTSFSELFMQPLSLIVQPLRDEATIIQLNQSLKRILELDDPDAYFEDAVDELVANMFVYRREGGLSGTTIRVYYIEPKAVSFLKGSLTATSTTGLTYTNTTSVALTAQQMSVQSENEYYYYDVPVEADSEGTEYDVDIDEIVVITDPQSVKVRNSSKLTGGADRETNTELITRAQESIGVRDMNTGKGFNAIMFDQFKNQVVELQPIGFGDPEMMRDIYFNYHIGGRIDGYVKAASVLDGSFSVLGLNIDFSRRLSTITNLVLTGTRAIDLGRQNLDITEHAVKVYNVDQSDKAAVFVSYVNLANSIDLSTYQFIRVGLENKDPVNIKISGAHSATTQVGEIINRINVGLGQTAAFRAVNPIIVSRRSSGNVPEDGSTMFIDPTQGIFSNVAVGDNLYVMTGANQGTYVVESVLNDNELVVVEPLPFAGVDINFRISRTGTYLKILSQTKSVESAIYIGTPTLGPDALEAAIGLSPGSYQFHGTGSLDYLEGVDYRVDPDMGTIARIIGDTPVPNTSTGRIDKSIYFEDDSDIFLNVMVGDIITITGSSTAEYNKDVRVLEKITSTKLRVDMFFATTETGIWYRISRTGIKDGDVVQGSFDYNPMTIDIGNQIQLDTYGRVLGVRPGRENFTITDLAFLFIKSIELVNPVTGEPLGEVLDGKGGYGRGGYGRGGYGRGSQAQYFLNVNKPELRFSSLEDSFIAIDTAYLGQSFKVSYAYVPDVVTFQEFASSDRERVLDAHILIKHFLPAVVDITGSYTVDPGNTSTPDDSAVNKAIYDYINKANSGDPIDASDISDVIYGQIDPTRARRVKTDLPIKMYASIHNTDGSQTIIESLDTLEVPNEAIPSYTAAPLSPRITHWIAGDINFTRVVRRNAGGL